MLIDWFTVAAQIVNFLILVALMQRFLYGPLIRAIDAREARIAVKLAEAARKQEEARLKTEQVEKQLAELESSRTQAISDARNEAELERIELVQNARNSVRAMEAKWREDLRLEEESFFREVRRAAAAEMLAITRRALADLASSDIERGAFQAFLEKLHSFDAGALKTLSAGGMVVVSAVKLSAESRRQIEDAVEERVGRLVTLSFEEIPEIGWGIELRGGGQRIGWTPDRYLDALEEKLRSDLNQRAELGDPVAVA